MQFHSNQPIFKFFNAEKYIFYDRFPYLFHCMCLRYARGVGLKPYFLSLFCFVHCHCSLYRMTVCMCIRSLMTYKHLLNEFTRLFRPHFDIWSILACHFHLSIVFSAAERRRKKCRAIERFLWFIFIFP